MSYNVIHWITLGVLWIVILRGMRDSYLARQARQRTLAAKRLVSLTGLSPLQIQVALDAGEASFMQRLDELRGAHG